MDGEARTRHQARLRRLRHALLRPDQDPGGCPQCGTEQPIEQPRPRRTVIEERRPKKPSPAPSMEEAEIEVEGVEEEGEEIEDADELEDDADTIGPEIEVEPDHDRTER